MLESIQRQRVSHAQVLPGKGNRGAPPGRSAVPGIAQAVERQNRAMRELSHRAFPEPPAVPDGVSAPIEQAARMQRRRQAAATEAAVLRRARAQRAARTQGAAGRPGTITPVVVPGRLDCSA
ncbi:hypothetical protein ACFC34_36155 [Streptomyces sp. NPDC056053]|uniref:hypothetical protein n=1 Tax=Streptomyces sp. NPDC056053 TaxID=3345696 RepID=UPI0035D5CBF4